MVKGSLALLALSFSPINVLGTTCAHLNSCNSHGTCDTNTGKCNCYNGWGSATDIAVYKAPDCSMRVCPSDRAWVDIPTSATTAHGLAECSNAGLCDRTTGKCRCFAGYEGEACQRSACPGTPPCSGHGKCISIKQMASEKNALPFGSEYSYGGDEDGATWDENKIYGCVCDSGWTVGYAGGNVQTPQWFGPDCSLKHCPSGDDPRTTNIDETDCESFDDNGATFRGIIGDDGKYYRYSSTASLPVGVAASVTPAPPVRKYPSASPNAGALGNKCHVDCSNRGVCNHGTGTCTCFKGYSGENCGTALSFY